MDKKVIEVFNGYINNLPAVNSKIVRVFTSSTFTDTQAERNWLLRNIYPRIKEYCRNKYGIDFQVVDMRWGVRDEAADDHITSALCLQEIRSCQKISVGPNFVTFLGQRYGYRPIPSTIAVDEFEMLLDSIQDKEKQDILQTWYMKDTNSLPALYVLQKISSRIPGYISKDTEKRKEAQMLWHTAFTQLKNVLREAAQKCLSKDEQAKYFMSVTEDEIRSGLHGMESDINDHCQAFIRIITDLNEHLDHPKAWRYIDKIHGDVDQDAQGLLTHLRDSLVPKELKPQSISRYDVRWSNEEEGVGMSSHETYLNKFGEDFYNVMVSKIDNAVSERIELDNDPLYYEALQHLRLAKSRCDIFHGRNELLDKLKAILDSDTRQPIVVHGQSGCGKTSIMAMAVKKVRKWIPNGKGALVIARFLGTTPKSTGILSMLISICKQVAMKFKVDFNNANTPSEMKEQLLTLFGHASEKCPIVILLDSLDQLSSEHNAHKLSWLPFKLPANVHVVVSTLPDVNSILSKLQKHIKHDNFIRVQSLGDELGSLILSEWLKTNNRTLTPEQNDIAIQCLKKCSLPLYTRLLYENVCLWKSYTEAQMLPTSIRDIIKTLFARLETAHGKIFVQRALGYITASKNGLSEVELEDVISLDDDVLNEAFHYHIPPVRRIPQLLIVRLGQDINHYVVNRDANGIMVIYWYHRQFIETATERYLRDKATFQLIHRTLGEFYLGTWHNKAKDFTYTEHQAKKLGLSSPKSSEDRKVAAQPIIFSKEGNIVIYNKRKLSNICYHLYHAGMIKEMMENCLLNYDWLDAKLKASSLNDLLSDLEYSKHSRLSKTLMQSLGLARSTLSKLPETFACEVLSRIRNLKLTETIEKKLFGKLIHDALIHGTEENALVPVQQLFDDIDERLKFDLEHPGLSPRKKQVCLSSNGQSLYSVLHGKSLASWDMVNGELEQQIQMVQEDKPEMNIMSIIEGKNKDPKSNILFVPQYAVFASSHQQEFNPIVVVNIANGEIKHNIELKRNYPKIMFDDKLQLGYFKNKLWSNAVGIECAVFDLESGEAVHVFESKPTIMHCSGVENIALLYIKQTKSIEVYSMKTLQFVSDVMMTKSVPRRFVSSNDGTFVLGEESLTVTLWDFTSTSVTNRELVTYDFGGKISGKIFEIGVSSDFTTLFVSHKAGVILWNIKFNKFIKSCVIPKECVPEFHRVIDFKTVFTADNQYIASAFEGYVIVWPSDETSNKSHFYRASHDTNRLIGLVPSVNIQNNIIVANKNSARVLKVVDVQKVVSNVNSDQHVELKLDSGARYLSTAKSNGRTVCRTYNSNEVCIFDATSGKMLHRDFQDRETMKPSISKDGRFVMLYTYNGASTGENLHVYDTNTGKLSTAIPVNPLYLRTYNISHSGDIILTHSEETVTEGVELVLWKSSGFPAVKLLQLDCPTGGISILECVMNDTYVITLHNYSQLDIAGESCDIRVYSIKTGQVLHHSGGYARDSLASVVNKPFFYIGKLLKKDLNTICKFDLETMSLSEKNIHHIGNLYVDKEGERGVDTAIQVFDLIGGKVLVTFGDVKSPQIRQNPHTYPKISPDGKFVAWLAIKEACVFVGSVDTKTIIGKACIHSTPLSLQLCYENVVCVGSEEGYILLFKIVKDKQETKKILEAVTRDNSKDNTAAGREHSAKSSKSCCML